MASTKGNTLRRRQAPLPPPSNRVTRSMARLLATDSGFTIISETTTTSTTTSNSAECNSKRKQNASKSSKVVQKKATSAAAGTSSGGGGGGGSVKARPGRLSNSRRVILPKKTRTLQCTTVKKEEEEDDDEEELIVSGLSQQSQSPMRLPVKRNRKPRAKLDWPPPPTPPPATPAAEPPSGERASTTRAATTTTTTTDSDSDSETARAALQTSGSSSKSNQKRQLETKVRPSAARVTTTTKRVRTQPNSELRTASTATKSPGQSHLLFEESTDDHHHQLPIMLSDQDIDEHEEAPPATKPAKKLKIGKLKARVLGTLDEAPSTSAQLDVEMDEPAVQSASSVVLISTSLATGDAGPSSASSSSSQQLPAVVKSSDPPQVISPKKAPSKAQKRARSTTKQSKPPPKRSQSLPPAKPPVTNQSKPTAKPKKKPSQKKAVVRRSAPISPSPALSTEDNFTLFLRKTLPAAVPDNLMEHLLYLTIVFVSPKEYILSDSLFALHQDHHWHTHGPQEGERGFKPILDMVQGVLETNKGVINSKLLAERIYYCGYVQAALESLMGEILPANRDQRKDRLRLPFFFRLCQDCRLVLLQVLFLINSPAMGPMKNCQYDLPADTRSFLTSEGIFVDYYNYFKPSRVETDFIANTLKWYCVPVPDEGVVDLV